MTLFWHTHYIFLVIAIGLSLLAIGCAVIGSSLVIEKQSQLGDALGHASYPGVIIAFILFQQRQPLVLLLGAVVASLCAIFIIHWLSLETGFHYESILALVLSAFFGLGMVLMSYIQGNPKFANVAQAGLNTYIMGQAAYLTTDDIVTIAVSTLILLGVFLLFLSKIKIVLFDKAFAQSIGINVKLIQLLNLLLAICVISLGLKAVGALLISSLLIIPTIIAYQWTQRYEKLLIIASGSAVIASLLGTYLSTTINRLATGPTVVVCLFIMMVLSLVIGPHSSLSKRGINHD